MIKRFRSSFRSIAKTYRKSKSFGDFLTELIAPDYINYKYGLIEYDKKNFTKAISYFEKVKPASVYYVEAKRRKKKSIDESVNSERLNVAKEEFEKHNYGEAIHFASQIDSLSTYIKDASSIVDKSNHILDRDAILDARVAFNEGEYQKARNYLVRINSASAFAGDRDELKEKLDQIREEEVDDDIHETATAVVAKLNADSNCLENLVTEEVTVSESIITEPENKLHISLSTKERYFEDINPNDKNKKPVIN